MNQDARADKNSLFAGLSPSLTGQKTQSLFSVPVITSLLRVTGKRMSNRCSYLTLSFYPSLTFL